MRLLIINIIIISLFQIYLVMSYLFKKKWGMFLSSLATYTIIILLLLYEYYSNLNIAGFIITCSLISVISHSFIGEYLNLYHSSKHYDRYTHLFGSFSFSLLSYSILNSISVLASKNWIVFLFTMLLGISIGVFYEIIEYLHDCLKNKKIVCQHGLTDTNVDLIFDVFGSIIAGFVAIYIF